MSPPGGVSPLGGAVVAPARASGTRPGVESASESRFAAAHLPRSTSKSQPGSRSVYQRAIHQRTVYFAAISEYRRGSGSPKLSSPNSGCIFQGGTQTAADLPDRSRYKQRSLHPVADRPASDSCKHELAGGSPSCGYRRRKGAVMDENQLPATNN